MRRVLVVLVVLGCLVAVGCGGSATSTEAAIEDSSSFDFTGSWVAAEASLEISDNGDGTYACSATVNGQELYFDGGSASDDGVLSFPEEVDGVRLTVEEMIGGEESVSALMTVDGTQGVITLYRP